MDLLVRGALELLVAWQSEVALEAEAGLGQHPWGISVARSAERRSPTGLWTNTQQKREGKG
eukprot:IDg2870t1